MPWLRSRAGSGSAPWALGLGAQPRPAWGAQLCGRVFSAGCSLGQQADVVGSRAGHHQHLPLPLRLCFESPRGSWCRGWLGPCSQHHHCRLPAPPQGVGETEMSWQHRHTCTKKGAARSKIRIPLENKEKPVSRKAEVDLLCILTIYGVLMGLFKSCFTLLFNKKHIYHSNHLGREEHILPPRWRPPSKRATAGICNVIFCATYNVEGERRRGSEVGERWVSRCGGAVSARFNVYF